MSSSPLMLSYTPSNKSIPFDRNSEKYHNPSMKQSTLILLYAKPQVKCGERHIYLLPKAVAQFNKDHGKDFVV